MEDKERILNHSKEKFFREGFYKTTMDEISTELRISKKTIYKYFPSKEKLIQEVTSSFREEVAGELTSIIKSKDPALIRLMNMLAFLGKLAFRISDKMLVDLQTHYPLLWREIDEYRTRIMTRNLTELIKQGKKEGSFAEYPEELVVTIFVSSIRAIVNPVFLVHHQYSFQQTLDIAFSILMNGVITEKGKKLIGRTNNRKLK